MKKSEMQQIEKQRIENDQGQLIQFIKDEDYNAAWEYCKYIGYSMVNDMHLRYIIFYGSVQKFDYNKNNNFILWYKNALEKYRPNYYPGVYVKACKNSVRKIQNQQISPEDDETKFIKEAARWR